MKKNLERRVFAAGGFGLMAAALSGELHAQQAPATGAGVDAVKAFHKSLETVVAGGIDNFATVTTDDVVIWTPGLGPAPFVGREASYKRWVEIMKDRNGIGLRSELLDVVFAQGAYVITHRNDWRVGPDGKEANAGTNIMGLYAVANGKVRMWYNPGGGPAGRGRGPQDK